LHALPIAARNTAAGDQETEMADGFLENQRAAGANGHSARAAAGTWTIGWGRYYNPTENLLLIRCRLHNSPISMQFSIADCGGCRGGGARRGAQSSRALRGIVG